MFLERHAISLSTLMLLLLLVCLASDDNHDQLHIQILFQVYHSAKYSLYSVEYVDRVAFF